MKRHTMWSAVCLLVCLLVVATTDSFALSVDEDAIVDAYIITEPYEYPVVPGTDEWKTFTTHEQMIQACQIPESILKRMTTEALLLTVMDFPLLGDTLLFDNEDAGYKALKENCNALIEFLERDDAVTVFNNYHTPGASICSYSDGYLKTIANICFELIYSKEFAQPANMYATFPTKVRNNNVKTPKGTQVYHYENLTLANHGYFEDSFLIESAQRYDIKGRAYIETPKKYYFCDLGLRNARINFRQFEQTHSMENIVYNELRMRGYSVDVGVVPIAEKNQNGKVTRKQLEVDFVCNLGSSRYYIQSAYALPDEAKRAQEIRPFRKIDDSFKKIIITKDMVPTYYDEYGILTVNIYDFLLDPKCLEK